MEEQIVARIKELEQAEEQAIARINAIRGGLAELRALIAKPVISGDPLDKEQP